MSICSKKCNEIKEKIDSISGLSDKVIYEYLILLEDITNEIIIRINNYADENELNGTCFKKLKEKK